ncbi:MAG: hypothetical protein CSA04_02290, partial [Bacteroidetes bacterium]
MAKLSVVIITYNEEHNIERCLESVKEIASEIVVVDSHSQDRTVALCRQQGARVILHPFENFGKQKQFAQSQATHEWILSLDADEQLSPALQKSIKEALEEPRAEAFSMNRLTNFCGQWIRHGGWYPDRKVRLYRKECARWSNHPVHEQLEVQEGAMTAHLKGDLLHYSIYDLDHHIRQINRYSTIAAEEMVGQRRSINGVMTIIHLSTPQSWRGGEQQVAYLIEELEKSGVDQILITPYGSRLSAYCKSRNITIYHFKRCSALNVQMALLLRKLCKRVQEPILHAHDANAHTAAFLSHLFFGNRAPLLISRRVDFPIHRSLFSRLKYNHKRIKRIICVSEKIKEIMVPALKDPSVLQVIYSGIDLNRFDDCHNRNLLRKEFKIPADHTLVANVAAIVPHKDYYTFVDTAAHVLKVHPKTTFLIIGEGEEREQITAYIHE